MVPPSPPGVCREPWNHCLDLELVAKEFPQVEAALEADHVMQLRRRHLDEYGSWEGPFFVAEARSLPCRRKSSPDVSLLKPLGCPAPEGWPFGAVIQVRGRAGEGGSTR